MNRLFHAALLLSVLCLGSGCALGGKQESGLLGKEAPLTRLTDIDGTYYALSSKYDRPVVLIFWASWCSYSRPVVKELNDYAPKHPLVQFITASIDDYEEFQALKDIIQSQHLDNLSHAFSGNGLDDEAYQTFNVQGLPHIFVLDQMGKIVGEGHSLSAVRGAIERAESAPPPSTKIDLPLGNEL